MAEHTKTLDIRSFSQSTSDSRCLEVWFARNVTDADRAGLLRAVNRDHYFDALVKALEAIRDRLWRDGGSYDERISDLKHVAAKALAVVQVTAAQEGE